MSLLFSRKHRSHAHVAHMKTRLAWKVCAMEPKFAVRQVRVIYCRALAVSHWSGWGDMAGQCAANSVSKAENAY